MDRQRRSSLIGGLLLLLLGGWFLAVQLLPGLASWARLEFTWPLIIIGVGGLLFLLALLLGEPDMAVPAVIVAGIGGLLYWQNATGNWASWAYVWTLIPGFAGVGRMLSGVLGKDSRLALREGGNLIIASLVMFAIFSSFLGGRQLWGPYWPVLLILAGAWLLLRALLRR